MSQLDEPNVVLPLASSYNTRGVAGFTNAVTNALDQRKINSIYEPTKNAMTGKSTLELAKRPGVADVGSTYGTTGQLGYLWEVAAGATTNAAANRWVFSTSGNDCRASDSSTTTVIVTAAGYAPVYVDKTAIDGTDTVVVQLRNAAGSQTAWTSTAIGAFSQISTAAFTALAHQGKMEFLDGFSFISTRNRVYNSDINKFTGWTGFLDRQSKQDIGTGLAKLGRQIISFGTASMEVYDNAGTATFSPLVLSSAHQYGLASTVVTGQRHYSAVLDGRLYWVGANPGGVFAFDGKVVEKVSSIAIDKILSERQFYAVSVIGWQGQRAIAISIDTVDAATQRAFLFFPRWNDWFEWHSTVFIPQACQRLENVCLGVGNNQHKLYAIAQTSDNYQDAGTDYTWTQQFKIPRRSNRRSRMPMCGVVASTARSASSLGVSFSDDDGQTWSAVRNIDLTVNKKHLYRCGAFTDRTVRLTHTANLDCRVESFIARVA